MQEIEPSYQWESIYNASHDPKSPFYGRTYSNTEYVHTIYSYYIHPLWDEIDSETLYCKILFTDYSLQFTIIELMGEWNDTLHNDIMLFKRGVIDHLLAAGIKYFILVGENVFNFHGSWEDDYYAEWFEEVEDGWIAGLCFPEFIEKEWNKYKIDYYINFGGTLQIPNWRTAKPEMLFMVVHKILSNRLGS
ncbi:hypothetical protein EWU23_11410 [Cytophagaceae bacterium 50C-KIRBA]|uniref:Uncharacterized protein n=1 Tax=Aquirufa beregesia TaxID=2516556 RepID=A0ABX0EY99_9BACT|nr:hypothetical protein [Aquirufa beregesia]NGZ45083.1 hypothetical protein [Aquirufa beregesia]